MPDQATHALTLSVYQHAGADRAITAEYVTIPIEWWREENIDLSSDEVLRAFDDLITTTTLQEKSLFGPSVLRVQNALYSELSQGRLMVGGEARRVTNVSQWYTYNWANDLSRDIHALTFDVDGETYIHAAKHVGHDARVGFEAFAVGRVLEVPAHLDLQVRVTIRVEPDKYGVYAIQDGEDWTGGPERFIDFEDSLPLAGEALQKAGISIAEEQVKWDGPTTYGKYGSIEVTDGWVRTTDPNVMIQFDTPWEWC